MVFANSFCDIEGLRPFARRKAQPFKQRAIIMEHRDAFGEAGNISYGHTEAG